MIGFLPSVTSFCRNVAVAVDALIGLAKLRRVVERITRRKGGGIRSFASNPPLRVAFYFDDKDS
jgi:hypothetical protein